MVTGEGSVVVDDGDGDGGRDDDSVPVLFVHGLYRGTQLDGLSAGYTIRVNGYIPCVTELYGVYHCTE